MREEERGKRTNGVCVIIRGNHGGVQTLSSCSQGLIKLMSGVRLNEQVFYHMLVGTLDRFCLCVGATCFLCLHVSL